MADPDNDHTITKTEKNYQQTLEGGVINNKMLAPTTNTRRVSDGECDVDKPPEVIRVYDEQGRVCFTIGVHT